MSFGVKGRPTRLSGGVKTRMFQSPVMNCSRDNELTDAKVKSLRRSSSMNNISKELRESDSGVGSLEMKELSLNPSSLVNGESTDHTSGGQTLNQQFLILPQSEQFLGMRLSPRVLRRTISTRSANEIGTPRLRRPGSSHCFSPESPSSFYGDSISAINVPITQEMTKQEKSHVLKTVKIEAETLGFMTSVIYRPTEDDASAVLTPELAKQLPGNFVVVYASGSSEFSDPARRNLSQLLSSIYAVFVLMFGGVIYLSDQRDEQRVLTEMFSTVIAALGMVWLIVLHVDLCRYKREVLKQLKEREDAMQEASERFSNATEFIINSGYNFHHESTSVDKKERPTPPYRFLLGRHSGSFYLKIGMAAFCFGNLIYEGLQLGQHILNFADNEKKMRNCSRPSSVVLHIVLPLYAFYQLFITFKYSNIVINRHKALARFGLMHLIATCLCFWFSTIVEEAVEDYTHNSKNSTSNSTGMEFDIASFHIVVQNKDTWDNPYYCTADSVLSIRSMKAIPYLYPFAIEYNLLLAGIWYVVWQNIGKVYSNADPHHLRHTISQDQGGYEEITYQSNLVINADCHASNKGLFVGLFILLATIVTVIVFFVAMTTEGYQERAVTIHTVQEGCLTLIGLLAVIASFTQIHQLDLSRNPITFLDDALMFLPLPFYFVHGIMSVIAEFGSRTYIRLVVHVLVTLQVVIQTPFIIDGLRRCSNSQELRYKKPGREVITFLIILNLTLWIVNTFELKSVEHYHAQEEYFGDLIWMFIGHTTLPIMLFYRFHSSVCLADMWKSAYERETS